MEMLQYLMKVITDINSIHPYPIYLFKATEACFASCQEGTENPFAADRTLYDMLSISCTGTAGLYPESPGSMIFYGVLRVDVKYLLIIGPVAISALMPNEIQTYMKQHDLHDFVNFDIPNASAAKICSILRLIYSTIYHDIIEPDMSMMPSPDFIKLKPVSERSLLNYRLFKLEQDLNHHSYSQEKSIFEPMKNGNIAPAVNYIENGFSYDLGIMAHSKYQQSEYHAVIMISLAARNFIEAGLNQYVAYDINDLYLQAVSASSAPEQHKQAILSALYELKTELSRTQKRNSQSVHVERSKDYIARHIHAPFTLAELAEHVDLSPSYISALFAKEEQLTIKEYTVKQRVQAAQNMLQYSNYPIGIISNYLCFCSQSYFTTVFKQETGYTPLQYRNKYSRE